MKHKFSMPPQSVSQGTFSQLIKSIQINLGINKDKNAMSLTSLSRCFF